MRQVYLIGCSASKLDTQAPARKLYTGDLFRKAVELAELRRKDWLVLSAKHGVLFPDQEAAPYDLRLDQLDKEERASWAARCIPWLACFDHITWLCGSSYREAIMGHPAYVSPRLGGVAPLAGLGIGKQKAKLRELIELERTPAQAELF